MNVRSLAVDGDNCREILIKVEPPPIGGMRITCDVVFVVDVSGSMQVKAALKGDDKSQVKLSILDVVKHAVQTLTRTMGERDRVGIVAFSNCAIIVQELTPMNEAGKAAATEAVKTMHPEGQTNLWEGLKTGLDMLDRERRRGALPSVMLLTDGRADCPPPGGDLAALKQYRHDKEGSLPATLHTFGFGTEVDSKLLHDLACEGGGLYGYMNDAGMVGTTMVNCMANTLVTLGRNAQLKLSPEWRYSVDAVYGYDTQGSSCVPLGCLQFGQSKDVVIRVSAQAGTTFVKDFSCVGVTLSYDGVGNHVDIAVDDETVVDPGSPEAEELLVQRRRLRFTEVVSEAIGLASADDLEAAQVKLCDFADEVVGEDERMQELRKDVEGEACLAISDRRIYKTWGEPYLRSLSRAHLLQQCNNFKDKGVQVYGGADFRSRRDEASQMWFALPPPVQEQLEDVETVMAVTARSRDECLRALQASNNNVEHAVNILFEGGPPPSAAVPAQHVPVQPALRPATTRPQAALAPAPAPAPVRPAVFTPPPQDMARYLDDREPCFGGSSMVALASGGEKPFRLLRKGDRLEAQDPAARGHTCAADVLCIVKTRTRGGRARLVDVSPGMQATLWHPVRRGGHWVFPGELAAAGEVEEEERECDFVYTVVLAPAGRLLRVGGVWTVGLGHGLEGPVVGHAFWGGRSVLESLQRAQGWREGEVLLEAGCVLRDERGHACDLRSR